MQPGHGATVATTWKFAISDPGTARAAASAAVERGAGPVQEPDGRLRQRRAAERDLDISAEEHRQRSSPCPRRRDLDRLPIGLAPRRAGGPCVRPAPVVLRRGGRPACRASRRARGRPERSRAAARGPPAPGRRSARAPACRGRGRSSRPRPGGPRPSPAGRQPGSRRRRRPRTRLPRSAKKGSTASGRSRRRGRGSPPTPACSSSQAASGARTAQVGDVSGGRRRSSPGQSSAHEGEPIHTGRGRAFR